MAFVRAYLRASTKEQDAGRAKGDLDAFAERHGLEIAAYYSENESGASLARPELFRLLGDSKPGDILLVEQVDRLSRLNGRDWDKLKAQIVEKGVKVVALDLPTSWQIATAHEDDISARIFAAINTMMLDMLSAIARKDYDDRRRRQAQGIRKAVSEGKFKGRQEDKERNAQIVAMLERGDSWNAIIAATKCSRSTLSRLKKRVQAADPAA